MVSPYTRLFTARPLGLSFTVSLLLFHFYFYMSVAESWLCLPNHFVLLTHPLLTKRFMFYRLSTLVLLIRERSCYVIVSVLLTYRLLLVTILGTHFSFQSITFLEQAFSPIGCAMTMTILKVL